MKKVETQYFSIIFFAPLEGTKILINLLVQIMKIGQDHGIQIQVKMNLCPNEDDKRILDKLQ